MVLAGASFLVYFSLLAFFELWGLERLRWVPDPGGQGAVVTTVVPGSAAERAGFRPGDRLVGLDGQPILDILDWLVAASDFRPEHPYELDVERGGGRARAILTLRWGRPFSADVRTLLLFLSFRLPALAVAFVLTFARPREPAARVGAWLLAALAVGGEVPPSGMAAAWRALPRPLATALWLPYLSALFGATIFFTFAALFPRPLIRSPRWWAVAWLPALAALARILPSALRVAHEGRTSAGDLKTFIILGPTSLAYFLGGVALLIINYRRAREPNERRRIRVLVAGALVACAPAPFVAAQSISFSPSRISSSLTQLALLLTAALPLSFIYAVLRHRLFDIRVVVRAGLRHALARRVLLSLVPMVAALLVLDLVQHGDEPLLRTLAERGWIYVGLIALALFAGSRREHWLVALDRRFFRERYDAQRLLREVIARAREAASLEEAAPYVVTTIEATLHARVAALFVRGRGSPEMPTIAIAPPGTSIPPWPADSRLVGLLRLLGQPLEVAPTGADALLSKLPAEEVRRLAVAGLELVVPAGSGDRDAFLALGAKRSEEPYSREDRDLLMTVAASISLLLRGDESASTSPAAKPETSILAGRYRLGSLLGCGGMGAVYEASDDTLGRRVAVKVLREERARRGDALKRFRREARAAASFAHPNVVTIHDFGVDAEGRGFLVMELLTGETLREELRKEKRLSTLRTLHLLRGVGAAVEAAHRRHLVHRDLKPENVFLARGEASEVVKVLDFGLARLAAGAAISENETATRGLAGTLRYMAPEQLAGHPVAPSWDLWALAVIAYEVLTGAHPFSMDEAGNRCTPLPTRRPTPVHVHRSDAPPSWQDFFERALAREAHHRPKSASSLLAELEATLA